MDKFQMIIEAAIAKAKSDANIKKYVKEIQGNIKDLEIDIKVSDGNVKSAIKQVNKDLKDTAKLSQNAFKLDEGKVQTFNRIGTYISNNTKLTKDQVVRLEELRNAISNVNDKSGLDQIKTKFRTVTSEAQMLGTVGDSTFTRLGKNVKQFMSFMGAATITMTAINTVRGMVNEVKNLDDSLVELRKVSDLTGDSLDRFVDKAYNMGAEVARTGKEVIDATTVFKRAGYTLEQSLDMAKASLVMVNVGDGIRNVDEASSALIATLKGFKLSDTDAMSVIDMINETSNNAAIDFDNITEGLRRVSGTLSQTGTSIQQTIGLLTGGFGSLRDIEMVSSGLLMISQRLRGIGEDGEQIDGLAPKLKNAFKDIANIDIEDANGELRSTFDIISDMARVFPTLNSEQRQYLGELAAGNRQVKVLNAIVQGWDDVEQAVNSATNSQGSALTENEKVLNSISGKINAFKSAFQELGATTIDDSVIKFFIDLGTSILKVTTAVGGLIPVLTVLGTTMILMKTGILPTLIGQIQMLILAQTGYTASTVKAALAQVGLTGAIKATGIAIKSFMATNPIGWILLLGTAVFGVKKIYDHFNITLEEHQEILSQQAQAYDDATAKVKSLEGELESTRLKLEELNAIGGASVVKDGEQAKLEAQTEELQRQLDIEKEKQRIAGESAEKEAIVSLTKTISSEFETYSDPSVRLGRITYDNVTRDVELQRIMDKYDEIIDKQTELKKKQQELANNKEGNSPEFKANEIQLESLATRMTELKTRANELAGELQNEKESLIGVTEEGNILKKSVDGIIDVYRSWMGSSKDINDTNDNVTDTMSNTVTTLEAQNKAIDEYQKSISSIGKALSDLDKLSPTDIIDLMQQFPELAKYGFTGSEGIDALKLALEKVGTQLYNNLDPSIENVELFKQMYKEAMDASNSILTLSDALSKMNDSGKFLDDVKKEFKELGYISSETLNKIASKYPELEIIISQYTSGILKDASFVVDELAKAYDIDYENYKQLVITKMSTNEDFYTDVINNLPSWVENQAKAYIDDFDNFKSVHTLKLELLKQLAEAQEGTHGNLNKREQVELGLNSGKADNIQKIIDELDKSANISLKDLKGYTPSKTGGGSGKEKDLIKEAFDKKKNDIDHLLAMDEITQEDYYNRLEKLNEKHYGKNKKTHLEQYRQYVEEVYKGRKKIDEDNIKSKFDDLSHSFAMGDIKSEEDYQKQRWELAKEYYKKNKDYLGDWKKAQEDWYKWNLEQTEKSTALEQKKRLDTIDKIIDKYGELRDTINKTAENQTGDTQVSTYSEGIKYANKEIKYIENEIKKLNKRKITNLFTQDDYDSQLANLQSALSKARSSIDNFNKSISESIKKSSEETMDIIEKSFNKTTEYWENQKKDYSDIIKAQKDILQLKKEQNEYEKSIAKKTKEISKIESRMADLSKAAMTGDRQANAELKKLEEDLADKKEDLSDTQSDHEYDLANDALDKALDDNDKIIDAKLKAIKTEYEERKTIQEDLFKQLETLTTNAKNFTIAEYSAAIDEIAAKFAQSGIMLDDTTIGGLKGAQGQPYNNANPVYSILGNKSNSNMSQDTSSLSGLNKFLASQGYSIANKDKMVQLAQALGLYNITSPDMVGTDKLGRANKNLIMEELKRLFSGSTFSKGGIAKLPKMMGEDGFALIKNGEPILTVEQGKLFKELVNNIKPLNNLVKLSTPNLSGITNNNNSPNINITIPIAGNATPSTVSALNNAGNNIVKQIMDEVRKL